MPNTGSIMYSYITIPPANHLGVWIQLRCFDGRCSKALLLGLVILSLLLQQSHQAIDLLQNLGEIRLNMRQQGEQHQVFYRGIQLAKIVIDMGIKWN